MKVYVKFQPPFSLYSFLFCCGKKIEKYRHLFRNSYYVFFVFFERNLLDQASAERDRLIIGLRESNIRSQILAEEDDERHAALEKTLQTKVLQVSILPYVWKSPF